MEYTNASEILGRLSTTDWLEIETFEQKLRLPKSLDAPETATELLSLFWKMRLLVVFDWTTWDEGRAVFRNRHPGMFDRLDADTILRLLTAIVRSDRFCEGELASFIIRGDATKLFARLMAFRPTMRLHIDEFLRLYDNPMRVTPDGGPDDGRRLSHITAITDVLGEDVCAAVFKMFCEETRKSQVTVINDAPKNGKWLDRWIEEETSTGEEIRYQCEIKSWSATSKAQQVPLDAQDGDLLQVAGKNWDNLLNGLKGGQQHVAKVLLPMKVSDLHPGRKILPLLIFIRPISKSKTLHPLSTITIEELGILTPLKTEFAPSSELHVFSVSLYLRELRKTKTHIDLPLPNVKQRLSLLNSIVSDAGPGNV